MTGIWSARTSGRSVDAVSWFASRPPTRLKKHLLRVLLAGFLGVIAGVVTGWPMIVPLTLASVYGLPRLLGQTSGAISVVKIEAVAVWTEMLQSTMAASAGLSQAIISTAPLSPLAIRAETMRLAGRLSAGMSMGDALLLLAEELEDQSADRVICALQLAASSRAQRLGTLLMALADSTRDEVALRLRIETSRATVRSGIRTILVFSVLFAVGLILLAKPYLSPFGTPGGQVVLLIVGCLYGTGLTLMVALARPPASVRLLGRQVAEL
jgi:hypothetical protein